MFLQYHAAPKTGAFFFSIHQEDEQVGKYDAFDFSIFDVKSPIAAKAPETKTFYVIKWGPNTYVKGDDPYYMKEGYFTFEYEKGVAGAQRFPSLIDAAVRLSKHGRKHYGTIVRVTEVPGKAELRVVSKTKIDATKPVVLYSPVLSGYAKRVEEFDGQRNIAPVVLQEATVYPDLGEAILSVNKSSRRLGGRGIFTTKEIHVHQVETITTPSTFTEVEVK